MTEETQRLINSLKEKTSTIRSELVKLKRENVVLKEDLVQKEIDYDESQVKLSELDYKYNALKIAKSLQSGDDNEGLKKRIDAMVKEINTCIELIDE
ncbi:MAG: hypothetical protein PF444_05630 [Bacteroidales bacterium]|jgi:predicted nuclease with TOPRIM domain|nr:hypothetical protein [Bacteroidales bacterium]